MEPRRPKPMHLTDMDQGTSSKTTRSNTTRGAECPKAAQYGNFEEFKGDLNSRKAPADVLCKYFLEDTEGAGKGKAHNDNDTRRRRT